ncbi:MAG: CYTH domain-containing protein [Hyphomicrobiaceae bacterium]|nr:CYTH domain-containing protein [Hyphomicrobiaceae bacterium]
MAIEIERKFLVADGAWRSGVVRSLRIRQAYLRADAKASIRVRIYDDNRAMLTVKTSRADLRRNEFEYELPVIEAEMMLSLRQGHVIDKVRHHVPFEGLTWEVDVFEGDNAGLCVAEVELAAVDQAVPLPPWVGQEVTGQAQYYNGALSQLPFACWTADMQALAAG